jgi:hypothetical protein
MPRSRMLFWGEKKERKHPGNYFGIKLHNNKRERERWKVKINFPAANSRYQISFKINLITANEFFETFLA